jgi:hypothetical protein
MPAIPWTGVHSQDQARHDLKSHRSFVIARERSDEAIQTKAARDNLDCFAALAMTTRLGP